MGEPESLLDCTPDPSLLDAPRGGLPAEIGRPVPLPPGAPHAKLVGFGAALTGVSLLGGIALAVLGLVELLSGTSGLGIGALAAGTALVGTHWGWAHIAAATADALDRGRERDALARREQWLATIEPYTRYEVSTSVAEDGSIMITRARHRPVRHGRERFGFERTIEHRELHAAEEPGAEVAERAEALRRQAALDTERERRRYHDLRDSRVLARIAEADERERRAAKRAASGALSERINANLREPPLEG